MTIYIVLGFTQKVFAQKISIPEPEMDSTFVQLDYQSWSVRTYGVIKYHNLVFSNNNGQQIKYTPTDPYSIGFGFAYKFIILDAGVRINKNNRLTRFDFYANLVFEKNMGEILLQRYEGFQEEIGTKEGYFRDDIKSDLLSISHFYNFNNKKLSLASTFSGNKVQKKSTGAFLLGGYFSYSKIEADSSIIPFYIEGGFNENTKFTTFSMTNFGIYFGYAYSLVLPKNIIVFASFSPGIGLNFATAKNTETYHPPVFPAGKGHLRISAGYYSKRIYLILGLTTNANFISLGKGYRFRQNGGQIKLVFGYRFYSKNPLTKTIDKTF